MSEETKERQGISLNFIFAVVLVFLLAFAAIFNIFDIVGEDYGSTPHSEDDKGKRVLLDVGMFSFWLICLGAVLVAVFKVVELSGRY